MAGTARLFLNEPVSSQGHGAAGTDISTYMSGLVCAWQLERAAVGWSSCCLMAGADMYKAYWSLINLQR